MTHDLRPSHPKQQLLANLMAQSHVIPTVHVTIFGATGGTGRHLVTQALGRGMRVRAFVRNPVNLTSRDPGMEIVTGDALNQDSVNAALAGTGAVISVLGRHPSEPSPVCSEGTRHIVRGMRAQGVRRLICVTSVGVGEHRENAPLLLKLFLWTILKGYFADKAVQESVVRDSDLDWILVRPVALTDGPATGKFRAGQALQLPRVMLPSIPRPDVASFLLDQVTSDLYVRQTVILAPR